MKTARPFTLNTFLKLSAGSMLACWCLFAQNAHAQTKNQTTTALVVSPPTATVGGPVSFRASVSGSTTWLQVNVYDGTTLIAYASRQSLTAAETVPMSVYLSTLGPHALTARYLGNAADAPSVSAPVVVNVTQAPTRTLLTAPSVGVAGVPVTIRVQVAGFGPTGPGVLAVTQGGVTTTQSVVLGAASALTLRPGVATLTASYPGDTLNLPSSAAPLSVRVDAPVPTSPTPSAAFEYDAEGHRTRASVGAADAGVTTVTRYDGLGRPVSTTNGAKGVTQYGFDGVDRPLYVADPRTLITEYVTDGLGNAQLLSPDTGERKNRFDEAGNLLSSTDARGAVTTLTYDAANRPLSVTQVLGTERRTTVFAYEQTAEGRLASAQTPETVSTYTYQRFGKLTSETRTIAAMPGTNAAAVTLALSYSYDAYGQLSSVLYPSGRRVYFTSFGQNPTSISLMNLPLLSEIQSGPSGLAESWNWNMSAGLVTHLRSFDSAGRMVRYPLGKLMRDVKYDSVGLPVTYSHFDPIQNTTVAAEDQAFAYDPLGRLVSATRGAATTTFEYDENGNRRSQTVAGQTRLFTVSPTSNALLSATNPAQAFTYDAVGNTLANGRYVATYSAANRLSSLTVGGVTTFSTYDERGRRVRKFSSTGPASTVLYAYDAKDHLVGEYGASGETLREFIWLGDIPVVMMVPNANTAAGVDAYFIHADHLNTPRVVVDRSGAIRWRWLNADPFGAGAPEPIAGGVTCHLRLPGQVFDPETGLHANHHRDYDPVLGRYLQSDPIGLAGGLNTYVFVNNSPTSAVDADGRVAVALLPAAAALAAAAGTVALSQSSKDTRLKYEIERLASRIREACRKCPPCEPVVGTGCWIRDTGHFHKGLDPHYHIAIRQQDSNTCKCSWDKKKDDKFTFAEAPPALVPCTSYPSFLNE